MPAAVRMPSYVPHRMNSTAIGQIKAILSSVFHVLFFDAEDENVLRGDLHKLFFLEKNEAAAFASYCKILTDL